MRPSQSLAGLAVAIGLLCLVRPAQATVVLPLSLEDLAERSDVVAHVRVGAVHLVSTAEAPFRVTELEVVEVFAGGARPGDVLELWQRGDGHVIVVGDPWLQGGEEGLVFLRRVEGRIYLTALAQSWWRFEGSGQGRVARRDLSQLEVVETDPPVTMPPSAAPWETLRRLVVRACAGRSR